MSTISLEKIALTGYKFLSYLEFDALKSYSNCMTYFIYDPDKGNHLYDPRTFTSSNGETIPFSGYAARAERCVYIDENGGFNEVYEVVDSEGYILYTYGTEVTIISGPSTTSTIKLPVLTKYMGHLETLPNTSNRLFIGWYKGDELITDETRVQYGDSLKARFQMAGPYTHPFGVLLSDVGKWEYSSSDDWNYQNGFGMIYKALYYHEPSHFRIYACAYYDFSNDKFSYGNGVYGVDISFGGMGRCVVIRDSFDVDGEYEPYSRHDATSCRHVAITNTEGYYTEAWWFSPYGYKLAYDLGTREIRISALEDTDCTYLQFHRNDRGATNTLYFGPGGTGSVYKMKNDGSLELVISGFPARISSQISSLSITWSSGDTGMIVCKGSWSYIGLGTNSEQVNANYNANLLIDVPIYAQPTVCAYGFSRFALSTFGVMNDFTLVGTSTTSGCFCGGAYIQSVIFAKSVTTTTYGLYGLTYMQMRIETLNSPSVGWLIGTKFSSHSSENEIGADLDVGGPIVIHNINNASSQNLVIGASKCISIEIEEPLTIVGSNSSAQTFQYGNLNSIKDFGMIVLGGIYEASNFQYGCFYNLTDVVVWFKDMSIEDVRTLMGSTGYLANNGLVFVGKDFRGYEFANSGTEPIDRFMYQLKAYQEDL